MSTGGWTTHSSREVYGNRWIRVREDAVTGPDGEPGIYGVVEVRHPAVFVVAVTAADEVLLVRQHRYAIGRSSLEVPCGGSEGEDPVVAGARELFEETGWRAGRWDDLGTTYSLNGVCDAPCHVFLARELDDREAHDGDASEGISGVELVPWPALWDLVRDGGIHDGESLAALLRAAVALGRVS